MLVLPSKNVRMVYTQTRVEKKERVENEHENGKGEKVKMSSCGTKRQVYNGTKHQTAGGLQKKDLVKNKNNRIVSIKQMENGKKRMAASGGKLAPPFGAGRGGASAPRPPGGPFAPSAAPADRMYQTNGGKKDVSDLYINR